LLRAENALAMTTMRKYNIGEVVTFWQARGLLILRVRFAVATWSRYGLRLTRPTAARHDKDG